MNLFFLRHGIASEPGKDGLPKDLKDADRPLSAKGNQRMWHIAAAMLAMELKFDIVATSPLLRARQTALIISESMELRRKLLFTDNLVPDGNPKLLVDQLNGISSRTKSVLLVGHEPYLSRLISLLVAGNTTAAIDLRKGGLAKLEIETLRYARCATLDWLLTPKQLLLMK